MNPCVNTPVNVIHGWEGSSGVITSGTNGRTISPVTGSGNQYSSVLQFSSLHSSDTGNYTCASSVTSQSTSVCDSGLQSAGTSFSAGGGLNIYNMLIYGPFTMSLCHVFTREDL